MALHHYLPQDRLRALAEQRSLPARVQGAALFADISGFTALTESLAHQHGERRGVEVLTQTVSRVYDALIAEVERCGGSTLSFAGDATLCWFDAADEGADAAARAVQAALAMQAAMQSVSQGEGGASLPLALKVSVASGPARRFTVGDGAIQTLDVLAGAAVARVAMADTLAQPGDVLLDEATVLAVQAPVLAWRPHAAAARFAVVDPAWRGPLAGPLPAAAPGSLTAVPVLPPAERLRPWVLPFVYERERAGQGLFVTDLRPVVALFLRFGGLADAHGDLDDQAVQRLDEWISGAQGILQQHGGVLLELIMGDKGSYLYAAFGAAVAHEDDARRALRAATALRALFGAGFDHAPGDDRSPAGACIGVASGTLRVGGYGSRTRQSFGAQGDAVNAAARLMMLAQPGEILTSGRVRGAVALEFVLQPRPPIALRGKAAPMPVFALLGPQRPRARRLQALDFVLPMVGRDDAVGLLAQQLAEVQNGRGAVVFVQAEAGMGKSRLLAEGVRLALRNGFVGFGGAASSEGLRAPYRLWQGVWAALLDIDPALSPRPLARAVQAAVGRCASDRAEAWPLLGPVLGVELAHNAFTQALAPKDRKALLETLLLEALRHTAEEAAQDGTAVLLVLEDVHDADPLSIELLGAVVRAIATLPVLMLVSQRPPDGSTVPDVAARVTPAAALPGGDATTPVQCIELQGLDAAQAEQLIRAQLAALFPERAAAVPPALIERIVERAQGNPFTIEELLKHLRDRGLDPHHPDTWQALEWPVSLRSLVLSRIDRLGVPLQLALKLASVIGSPFSLADLQACHPTAGRPEERQAELMRLCELGLLTSAEEHGVGASREAAGPTGAEEPGPPFAFRHRVMLEVAYESIGHASRLRLHEQAAQWLESGQPERCAQRARALAHHWAQAERPDRACPYLRLAAEQAVASYANDEALAGFTQVLAWLPAADTGSRIDVLLRREALLDLLGRHDERRRDLAELDALAARIDDAGQAARLRQRLALRRASLELDAGDFTAAAAGARAALGPQDDIPRAGASEPVQDVEALLLLARVLFAGGQAELARQPLDRAQALAHQQGLADQEANALMQLGLVEWQLGHYDAAEALLWSALPAIQNSGALRKELDLLNNLGVVAKSRARFAEAVARYEQAQAIARRIGDRSGEAMLLNNMGSASLAAGDFYRAAQDTERAARIWAALNEPGQLGAAWVNRAEAHRELGQYALAQALGEQALALLRAGGHRRAEAIVLENLGRVAMAQGRPLQAVRLLEQALALAREIGLRAIEASTLFDIGRLHTALGEHARAAAALSEAGPLMAALGDPLGMLEVQTARADLNLRDTTRPQAERAMAARAAIAGWLPRLQQASPSPPAAAADAQLPMATYLVACRVLEACGDTAASALRARALAELRERAARITDPAARRDYLQISEHQALLADRAAPSPGTPGS